MKCYTKHILSNVSPIVKPICSERSFLADFCCQTFLCHLITGRWLCSPATVVELSLFLFSYFIVHLLRKRGASDLFFQSKFKMVLMYFGTLCVLSFLHSHYLSLVSVQRDRSFCEQEFGLLFPPTVQLLREVLYSVYMSIDECLLMQKKTASVVVLHCGGKNES